MRTRKHIQFLSHMLYIFIFSYYIAIQNHEPTIKINRYRPDLKHILIWTNLSWVEKEGQSHFIDHRCEHLNCYITRNRSLFDDVRYFDAIVFNLQDVSAGAEDLPLVRGKNQKYIFAANDSADKYPVCDRTYDEYFNWTWTYKSDSTVPYRFFSVSNIHRQNLGVYFQYRQNLDPLTQLQRSQMNTKHKIAATFLDTCKSNSKREEIMDALEMELAKHNQTLDTYGDCGRMKCRRKTYTPCYYRLRKNYFFFLAFEDSIAKDFVTDIVVHAYKNDVVPVVYGGASYIKFLPPHSYLDYSTFPNVSLLVEKMIKIKNSKPAYFEYLRWKNHYIFEPGNVLDPCKLCEMLNMLSMLSSQFTYQEFRRWWNPDFELKCTK